MLSGKKRKRGSIGNLSYVILVLIVLAITGNFVNMYVKKGISAPMDKAMCKMNLFAAQEKKSIPFYMMAETKDTIKACAPGTYFIDADKTTMTDKKIDDDKVKRILGDALLDCTNLVRDLDPYGDYEGTQNYCFICDNIRFTEGFTKKAEAQNYKVERLWLWLAKSSVPGTNTEDRDGPTYFEVITGREPTPEDEITFMEDVFVIDSFQDEHVTVWHVEKHSITKSQLGMISGISIAVGAVVGTAVGLVAGTGASFAVTPVGGVVVGAAAASTAGRATEVAVKKGATLLLKKSAANFAKKSIKQFSINTPRLLLAGGIGAYVGYRSYDNAVSFSRVYLAPKSNLNDGIDASVIIEEEQDDGSKKTYEEKHTYRFCTRQVNY